MDIGESMEKITDYIVPLLLLGCSLWALRKKENTYDLLLQGGQEGLKLVVSLIPTLIFHGVLLHLQICMEDLFL